MDFSATWNGTIVFKKKPSDDQIEDLKRELCKLVVLEPKYNPKTRWYVNVYGSGNYSDAGLYKVLNKIAPSIISGRIVFSGDEDTHWKIEYVKGKWKEENGIIVYSKNDALSEFPPISENDRAEFIGQIIDIFEDFLGEKGITIPNSEKNETDDENTAIIYGSDYGYCQDRLEEMMRNWKILEETK